MEFDKFKIMHSELISYYQFIENDLKWIYSYLSRGDVEANYASLSKDTLGQTLTQLKGYDSHRSERLFTPEFYEILFTIKDDRNYWCHQVYLDFSYVDNYLSSKEYNEICKKLEYNHKALSRLYEEVQKVRLKLVEYYDNKNK